MFIIKYFECFKRWTQLRFIQTTSSLLLIYAINLTNESQTIIHALFFSHRPLDLNNVFKEQIKILIKDGDTTIDDIPDPEKVIEYVSFIVNLI